MTNGDSKNIVDLGSYLSRPAEAYSTAITSFGWNEAAWIARDQRVATGFLNASAVQRLHPDAEVSRFLDLSARALTLIESCAELLRSKDYLGADDRLMASKASLSELLMFRGISDSVGLITLKCFQVACGVKAVTDAPRLPDALKHALHRIWAAPFMDFDEACNLTDEIENAVTSLSLPGYVELTNELVADAQVPETQ